MVANGVLGLIVLDFGALNKIGVLGSILLGEGKCSSSGSCYGSQMDRLFSNNYGE